MKHFILEAFSIGLKEGFKVFFCSGLVVKFLDSRNRGALKKVFFAAVLVVLLASIIAIRVPVTLETKSLLTKMIGFTFALFYLFSLAVLFHSAGTDILGPFKPLFQKNYFLIPLVSLLTIIYFIPDMTGSSLYLKDVFSMSGSRPAVILGAGSGFALSVVLGCSLARKIPGDRIALLGLPQILLLLAIVKLVAGGIRGFAELSLIPAVQAGLMKLIHDAVHHLLITIMAPDHTILSMTAWKFIAILFGDTFTLWLSLIVIAFPLVYFLKKHFSKEIETPSGFTTDPLRRRFLKTVRDERIVKAIPVFLFLLIIITSWFSQKGEASTSLYRPEPAPIAADGGLVIIPLHAPARDLLDGTLHKFSVTVNGESIRFLIMKRTDNTLAVCLDACEICPPEGYGQAEGHLVCLYCKTPIPIDTLGNPGGCNPVPVPALVTDKDVRIRTEDIQSRWDLTKSRQSQKESAGNG